MSNYTGIKALINADIRENNNEEITGQILNGVLLQMVTDLGAYQFAGVATPTTDPGTPDINVYYVAGTPGIYSYMGEFSVAAGEFAFLLYNGSWTKLSLPVRYMDASSDQNIGGNKTFTGNVVVYGNLGLVGGLSLGGDLSVDGNIGATGSIIAGGDLIGRELYEYDTALGDYVLLSQKYQALLQSGVNIKTINGISLLGSGDLVIQGGGSDPEAVKFIAQTLTGTQKAQARTNIDAGTYSKPSAGIPETDLTSAVRAKLPFVIDGGGAWREVEQAIIDHRVVIYREYNSGVTYICQGVDMDGNFVFTSIDGTTSTRMLLSTDDSWTTQTFQMYTQSEVNTALGNKQNLLTPGTNITISGNVISAENGIFLCTYGSTAVADIITALSAGKLPVCEHTDGRVYILAEAGASAITFTAVSGGVIYGLQLTYQGVWSTITPLQKVTSVSSSSTDNEIPTAKCLYDLVGDIESLLLALL